MINNISFNGEGPVMSGTWYNPKTGDSFTVEDSYFQDNQYLVKTTDGRMLDYNFIQNYKFYTLFPRHERSSADQPQRGTSKKRFSKEDGGEGTKRQATA